MTARRIALFLAVTLAPACVCIDLPNAIYAGTDGGCHSSGLPDLPDDCFTDDDHDGIDGQADASVFVDPLAGHDSHAGTMSAPVKTLSAALARALDGGLSAVLVAQGEIDESLYWTQPVSIYGGYVADAGWKRTVRPALLDGGTVAILTGSWAGSAVLDSVNVRAADAPAGGSSFAMIINGGFVTLRNLELRAGNGGDGASGFEPGPGQAGTHGNDGLPGQIIDDGGHPDMQVSGAPSAMTPGACSPESEAGGDGAGDGESMGFPPLQNVNCMTTGGLSSIALPGAPCMAGFVGGLDGGNGADAVEGPDGTDGDAGAPNGTIAGINYLPANGGDGHEGSPGKPGCGGGGGGSSRRGIGNASGGSGASGGTGGCGGPGGHAGLGGGASIAVLVVDGSLTLVDAGLFAGLGGNGGSGSSGGLGGQGAAGGIGGKGANICGTTDGNAGNGGNGGRGGNGGKGGSAGGGGGGPSVGIWCVSSTLTGDMSNVISVREGGAGGQADLPNLVGETGRAVREITKLCH